MNNLKKRCLTLLLSLAMIVTYMPTSMIAFAEGETDQSQVEQQVEAAEPAEEVTSDDAVSEEAPTEDVATEDAATDEVATQKAEPPEKTTKPAKEEAKAADDSSKAEAGLLKQDKTLKADGDGYSVSAAVGKDAKVPADTELQTFEIKESDDEYDKYYQEALEALEKEFGEAKKIKAIKFYDISLEAESQEKSVEPEVDVNVKIDYEKGIKMEDADSVHIVHFGDKEAEVLNKEDNNVETTVEKSKMTEASFDTDAFSVFAVIVIENEEGTLTVKQDGYEITINYTKEANIPVGTELKVEQIDPDSKEYKEYKNKTIEKLNEGVEWADETKPDPRKGVSSLALFDISLCYNGKEIEPDVPLDVHISYENGGMLVPEGEESFVVHFADKGVEIIKDVETSKSDCEIPGCELFASYDYKQDSFSVVGTGATSDYIVDAPVGSKLKAIQLRAVDTEIGASKTITDNRDGTYELNLSVTGSSESSSSTTVNKSNVVLVIDTSGSMKTVIKYNPYTYSSSTYDENTTYYGYRNNEYIQVWRSGNSWYRQSGYGYTEYNGTVYTGETRLDATKEAAVQLVDALLGNNKDEDKDGVSLRDVVEISLVTFAGNSNNNTNGYLRTYNNKHYSGIKTGSDATSLKNTINGLTAVGGTNWEAALKAADTSAGTYASQNEPTSVIFLTDGMPTFYGNDSGTGHEYDQYYGSYNRDNVHTSWDNAKDDARKIVSPDGYTLYTIFAFGNDKALDYDSPSTQTDADYLRSLTNYAYSGSGTYSNSTLSGDAKDKFFNANNTQALQDAFKAIINSISGNVGYGGVTVDDGVTTGVTSTSVTIDGEANPESFKYTVTDDSNNTVYTVKIHNNNTATFTIGGNTYNANAETVTTTINGTTHTNTVYSVTVGEGDNAKTYKMSPASIDDKGEVKWDLAGLGVLENGYTYSLSFDVWPNQDAYDTVADLNNGIITEDQIPASIKDSIVGPDANGKYSIRTNYQQYVDYYTVDTQTNEETGETTTTYTAQPRKELGPKDPVALTSSTMELRKIWDDSLDDSQLKELLYDKDGNPTKYGVRLHVWKADTLAALKNQIDSYSGTPAQADEKDYLAKDLGWKGESYEWGDTLEVAPGTMVTLSIAEEMGVDVSKHTQVTYNGTTYVVLESGHYYTVTEDNIDGHFELNTIVYHPMLVNGVLSNVTFKEDGTAEKIEPMSTVDATNTLKGGINIKKVIDVPEALKSYVNEDEEFTFTVKLFDSEGNPVYTGETSGGGSLGTRVYRADGTTERGTVPSNGEVTLTIKASESIRIVNVPQGTYYTVEEAELNNPAYEFEKIDWLSQKKNNEGSFDEIGSETFTDVSQKTGNLLIHANAENNVTFTNKFIGTGLDGTKTWVDNENKNGNRPSKITIKLMQQLEGSADWTVFETQEVKADNDGNWTYKFIGLPKVNAKGVAYSYKVEEEPVTGYTPSYPAVVANDDGTYIANVTNTEELVDLSGQKEWADADPTKRPESIWIEVIAKDGAGNVITLPEKIIKEVKPDENGNWTFTFTDLPKYVSGGTPVVYSIVERATKGSTDEGIEGYYTTYSTETDKDGNVTANVKNSNVSITLGASKTLSGRALKAGEFSFELYAEGEDSSLQTKTNAADGSVTFDAITYSEPGTYTYTIKEVEPTGDDKLGGVTYDTTPHTAVVTVSPNKDGSLSATVKYDGKEAVPEFKNEYAASGSTTLKASKTLSGRTFKEGDTFTFTVTGTPAPTSTSVTVNPTSGNDVEVDFGTISYTLDDLKDANGNLLEEKTYTYTLKETAGNIGGITYDTADKTVTVTISDNGDGTLNVVKSTAGQKTDATFANEYAPGKTTATLEAKKTLSGRALKAGEFSFELYKQGEETPLQTKTNAADGSVTFDEIEYTEPSTYNYTIKEVKGDLGGVTYDTATHNVEVSVEDNLDGTMTATVKYDGKETVPEFKNEYAATGETQITGVKTIENRAFKQGDSFTFEISGSEGAPLPKDAEGKEATSVTITPTSGASADFAFEKINYTLDDLKDADGNLLAEKTFTYTIKEVEPTGDDKLGGVTYDSTTKTVKVTVSDNGDGSLNVVKSTEDEPKDVSFNNIYRAAGKTTLDGTKTIENRNFKEGDSFTFEISGSEGAPLPKDAEGNEATSVTITPTSGKRAPISFGEIAYDESDIGKTYVYTVTETTEVAGITKSVDKTVTVAITDNGDGTLEVTKSYGEGVDALTLVNKYNAEGGHDLKASKTLTGRAFKEGDTFTFTVTAKEGTPMPKDAEGNEVTSVTVTPTSGNDVEVNFGHINFTLDDVGKTYTYTIKETKGSIGGITYNETEYPVELKVSLDSDTGIISAKETAAKGKTIKNEYAPAPTTATLEAKKTLSGRALKAGEFSFELYKQGEETPLQTKTNAADGSVAFDAITYSEPGTYNYTIKEVKGNLGGVTYDTATHNVKVSVEDNLDGTMTATVKYDGKEAVPEFKNEYAATGSKALEAKKVLKGRDLKEGEFSFELYKQGEKTPLQTKINAADGSVKFDALTFDQSDLIAEDGSFLESKDFTYTIKEVKGTLDGVTYDTTVHTAVVTVSDNGDGTLKVVVKYDGKDAIPVFNNTYTPCTTEDLIKVTKKLVGRDWLDSDKFEFTLKPVDGAPMPEAEGVLEKVAGLFKGTDSKTVSVTQKGQIAGFGTIVYEKAGTYKYTIEEVVPEGGKKDGITYDQTVYNVTVTVSKDPDTNALSATVVYDGTTVNEVLEITNTYEATGTVDFNGFKKLRNGDLSKKSFEVELVFIGEDGEEQVEKVTVGGSAEGVTVDGDDSSTSFKFNTISFTKNANGNDEGEYNYIIREIVPEDAVNGESGGVRYDTHEQKIKVTVEDNGKGTLNVAKDPNASDYDIKLLNSIPTPPVKKVYSKEQKSFVDGKEVKPNDTLTYTITYKNTTGKDAEVTITDTVPENTTLVAGSAKVDKGQKADSIDESGITWKFNSIRDNAEVTVSFQVTVNDSVSGEILTNDAEVNDGTNKYSTNEVTNPTPPKKTVFTGSEEQSVDGKIVEPGEILTYKIKYTNPADEAVDVTITDEIPKNTTLVDKGGATENNGTLTWTENVAAGKSITVTFKVRVNDNVNGEVLTNEAVVNDGKNHYTNEVKSGTPVKHDPPVLKILTGDEPEEDETFTFQLKAIRNTAGVENPMPAGSNGKTKTIEAAVGVAEEFGDIMFKAPGEYWYEISEVDTGLEGYEYDDTVYTLHYVLTRNDDGGLSMKLTTTTDDGKVVTTSKYSFVNDYTAPEEPKKNKKPDTGDHNNLAGWLALMALAGAGGTGLYVKRRREDE